MANSPIDTVPSMMEEDFGTKCLITDLKANDYLDKVSKHGEERYSRWCGGKDGFDDYCERIH